MQRVRYMPPDVACRPCLMMALYVRLELTCYAFDVCEDGRLASVRGDGNCLSGIDIFWWNWNYVA